ncbi:MAG: hypothetical protein JXB05_18605, partial [Myxococcaceae bacterium]|nr:hypothetical protein [Myxococcaceae bacterium]
EVVTNSQFRLRVEANSDGTDRLYTVPFSVLDNAGNVGTGECTFDVKAAPPAAPLSAPQSTEGSGTLANR